MASFDDNFEDLWRLAYRVAYRVLGDREDASDIAQESLARVARQWGRAESYAAALTAKIAGDRSIDLWRRKRRRSGLHQPEGTSPSPISIEERDELVTALRRLPTRQRETVVLRFLADLSERDTARLLRCTEGTVKQHVSRALLSLRTDLTNPSNGGQENV